MLRIVTLGLLVGCGGGPPVAVGQLSLEGGTGCAPEAAPDTVPRAFGVADVPLRLGLSLVDPDDGSALTGLEGRAIEVFELSGDNDEVAEGAPVVASGVVRGDGGVIDWRPADPPVEPGAVHLTRLVARVADLGDTPAFEAEVLRPLDDSGADVLCAYAANTSGQRVGAILDGASVTFVAQDGGLPSDVVFTFDPGEGQAVDGTPDGSGAVRVPGRVDLADAAFDGGEAVLHTVAVDARSAGEPGASRSRPFVVAVSPAP